MPAQIPPPISPSLAWERLAADLEPLDNQRVPLADAMGGHLARQVSATVDVPAADVSAMDGYCCRAARTGERLPVVGTAAAGQVAPFTVGDGQAAKIMTGAVVPEGADRVIPVELTDGGAEKVLLHRTPKPGAHIRRQGEVVRRGEAILPAGSPVTASAIALLATHGWTEVEIVRPPSVAVIVTGDEVIPADQQPDPGQLRDSNGPFLLAAGRSLGLAFRSLGIAGDRPEELRERIRRGLAADVLLLTGGVSMGEFDLVEDLLAEAGCRTLFDRVAIQPGKPLVAARHDGGWVFGLPGNPASVMVTFWLFVRPLLERLRGGRGGYWQDGQEATLAAPLPGSKGRDRFLPGRLQITDGRMLATPVPPKGSHDVVAYAQCDALIRIPAHAEPATPGSVCQVLPVP